MVVGGCDAWNCTNTVQMYDPQEDKWTNFAPMVSHRRGAGVAMFDGKRCESVLSAVQTNKANFTH